MYVKNLEILHVWVYQQRLDPHMPQNLSQSLYFMPQSVQNLNLFTSVRALFDGLVFNYFYVLHTLLLSI
jgi:hypothetical protein